MPSKILKRGKDTYRLAVSAGKDANGKQLYHSKTVTCESLAEAKEQWTLFAADILKGNVIEAGKEKMTLSEFYAYWLHHYSSVNNQKSTQAYNAALFVRIEAALGHLQIDKIDSPRLLQFVSQLRDPQAGHNDKPLAASTIKKHIVLLDTIFSYAVKHGYCKVNPAKKVELPKIAKKKKTLPTEADLQKFMQLLASEPIKNQLLVYLAFTAGLRREEIFGLQWGDIDFIKNTVNITRAVVYIAGEPLLEKGTKSDTSNRTISLPVQVIKMFEEYKAERKAAAKRKAKRNKIVQLVDQFATNAWIFTQPNGKVGHPHSFNGFLRRFCEENNLPPISPHTFRHLSGSYLLNAGLDLAAVSQKLGHSRKSFTADTYVHSLQSAEVKSAELMEGILTKIKKEQSKTVHAEKTI